MKHTLPFLAALLFAPLTALPTADAALPDGLARNALGPAFPWHLLFITLAHGCIFR
jgi:hypothetical protein